MDPEFGTLEYVSGAYAFQNPQCLTAFPLCETNKMIWDEGCSLVHISPPNINTCFKKDMIRSGEISILSAEADMILCRTSRRNFDLRLTGLLNSNFSLKFWTGRLLFLLASRA